MQIQINSDKTVTVDASLARFVKSEAERILETVAAKVTRVEMHLSDVNGRKSGPADKRCVVEARPAGARPLSTSATAKRLDTAIGEALRKMQRALRSSFGRHGRASTGSAVPRPRAKAARATTLAKTKSKVAAAARPGRSAPKAKPAATTARGRGSQPQPAAAAQGRGAKKTPIFQARRKAWPSR